MKAVLSVYDKTGLVEFARGLVDLGFEIYSTGGTKKALAEAGVPVHSVSELTGFPEIMGGRVKTLHPGVHAGILANREEPEHMRQLAEQGLEAIDLVAVNLYPFEATISKPGVSLAEAIENIDIGGPTMVRAAAKNHASVVIVVDPAEYPEVLGEVRAEGPSPERRQELARAAFAHTAAYDSAIAAYLSGLQELEGWPRDFSVGGHKRQDLRYGENPHQTAALYTSGSGGGVAGAEQLHGIELSYNNIVDVDAAWELVQDLPQPSATIIKHTNPCGAAAGQTLAEAYRKAYECDTVSAFGGIVALNQELDGDTARRIAEIFVEVVAAPAFTDEALETLTRKKKIRLLKVTPVKPSSVLKMVTGGFLVQGSDALAVERAAMRSAGRRQPTEDEWEQLLFAWRVVKHVKSNAIVLAHDHTAVGVGAGQMSRVESVRLAAERAGERARGTVLASDAFFPMPDGVEAAALAGITAVVQPGGSVKDAEVLAAADAAGMAMVYTGHRHFRH
ncbi:MAG TPA: bifunctional phosphoribosylaminoimidazolecarboxamide formyltransferase/IMP cyclohydrolase [Candidatus Dormibacteraeota bacterium]|nr:bifunctional phosphoribosylaminoimidazolecarboxamide formyltransferase/IMP cyclohydrolase [Candidatus Dormibacteraeota bacterium]